MTTDQKSLEKKHWHTIVGTVLLSTGVVFGLAIIYRLAVHGEKPGVNDVLFLSALIVPGLLLFNKSLGMEVLRIIGNKIKKDAV